jgi:DNA polymerase-3 subunit beta
MKFTIERDALTSALAQVRGIVKRANIIPILSCCKIEAAGDQITLTSTDMDMQASSTVHAEVETEGAIAIDAHALSDFVGRQPKASASSTSTVRPTGSTPIVLRFRTRS